MKKTLLALLGAVILLAVVLWGKSCSDQAMHRERYVFDPAKIDQVVRLEVIYGDDQAVLVKSDGGWETGSDGFPADTARLRNVLSSLLGIRATEKVSESSNPARLAEFGLSDGEAKRIRWKMESGEEYTVLLGKTSGADYSSTYWKWEDIDGVYRTPGNFTHEASARENDWKSRAVFPFFLYENVASVAVDWVDSAGKNVRYRIDRTSDTSAKLVEPFESPIPRRSAGSVYEQTPQFNVDALVEPFEDVAAMGLDTPQVKIEIVLKDKTVYRLTAGHKAPGGYRYALLPGVNKPIKISEWRFDFFRKTVDQLLNPPPLPPDTPEDAYQTINPEDFEPHGNHDH